MITNEELEALDKETLINIINYQSRAFNYKTRESNFFQLCLSHENGLISEEEYNSEIENNPEKYCIGSGREIDEEELMFCLWLIKTGLFGDNVDDEFYEIFDLNEECVNEICKQHE